MIAITEPTLLVDEQIVRQNIERMAHKAAAHGLELKPHFKTHQSVTIGKWMQDYGIEKITVSSVKMAEYFARAGWNDITIAFPCHPLQAERLHKLSDEIALSILISDQTAFPKLQKVLKKQFRVYIEIDTGANRTGFQSSQTDLIEKLAEDLTNSKNLHLKGFYSHPGHSYQCRSKAEICEVHVDVTHQMQKLKKYFQSAYPDIKTCIGDTPCCSVAKNFDGIDEISPGNFVFYDLMQQQIGACTEANIGVALACPVVAKYPKRNEIAVHGGAIHLSKESLHNSHAIHFGKVVVLDEDGRWHQPASGCSVKSISQEHGIVSCSSSFFKSVDVGSVIGILPVHSCLTANLMQSYRTVATGKKLNHMRDTSTN